MFLRLVCALFLPPLAVFLTTGLSLDFVINIILTLIGYVPGIIHAFWILSKEAENSSLGSAEKVCWWGQGVAPQPPPPLPPRHRGGRGGVGFYRF
jgi:uncharacterized membrane protein YqaE (UPF0057 family)